MLSVLLIADCINVFHLSGCGFRNLADTKMLFEASSWSVSGGEVLFDRSASVFTGAFRIYMEFLNI